MVVNCFQYANVRLLVSARPASEMPFLGLFVPLEMLASYFLGRKTC